MFRNRTWTFIFILLLCVSFTGCAGLQRKFARKKKKQEDKSPIVVSTYDYSKELRVDELYKKHLLFWQSWQTELLGRLDATYKKRTSCYDYTVASLTEMKKYLASPKAEELEVFIKNIKSIDPVIKKKHLSRGEKNRIKNLLEKTKRQIDKSFSYSDVKDYLELRKQK
ncbi:MAG: hypothetical protein HQ566_04580 [Candidatus Omnitrophica bacterium]|nr:hypothetical protein [Candidatus Omnitrophota bacterium]